MDARVSTHKTDVHQTTFLLIFEYQAKCSMDINWTQNVDSL